MSGLEALAALGLACNVFQVISFGRETLSLAKRVYQNGSIDPALTQNIVVLTDISSQIQAINKPASPTKQDQQLLDLGKKCQDAARDLQEEVAFVTGHAKKGSLVATLKTAAKVNWRKRRLETLERKLADVERAMQTGLLVKTFERAAATDIKVDTLDTRLQDFILQYEKGHTDTTSLVSKEASSTRALIDAQREKAEISLKLHITAEARQSEQYTEERLQEVNRSLRSLAIQEAAETREHVTAQSTKVYGMLEDCIKETTSQSEKTVHRQIGQSAQEFLAGVEDKELARLLEARRERLLRSLKFDSMNARRNKIADSHVRTLRWVLDEEIPDSEEDSEHPESDDDEEDPDSDGEESVVGLAPIWDNFPNWLRSNEAVYWISGKPASGKSTLVKYLSLLFQEFVEKTAFFTDICPRR